mmetsp:Transcript_6903/g.28570  ORF Transcript_6903/g.28570 Transcript_6903/m.28570 type:complete len:545 (+) Transcript_6903:2518-4152(+)
MCTASRRVMMRVSSAVGSLAYSPPTKEPIDVPPRRSTGTPSSSNAMSTPTCAKPRAPPPASTNPTLCLRSDRASRAACAGASPCAGALAMWWCLCTLNASNHGRVPAGITSVELCRSTSSRCASPPPCTPPRSLACSAWPSVGPGASSSSAAATSKIASACLAHVTHHRLGNGSAFKITTSFAASSCASQCAVASDARGPTPAWPTSARRSALSATRAAHVRDSAAWVAATNSSRASAAPSDTGTTATVLGANGVSSAVPWERPREVCRADEAAFGCVDALPGRWSARAPDIPPAEKRLPGSPRFCGEPTEDACENPPPPPPAAPPQLLRPGALAPMRHARDTNALGDTRASDSRPADGIHSSCASRTARVLESSEPGAAAESPPRLIINVFLATPPAWASPSSSSTPRSTVSSPTASPGPRNLAPPTTPSKSPPSSSSSRADPRSTPNPSPERSGPEVGTRVGTPKWSAPPPSPPPPRPPRRTHPVATTYTPSGCRPACDIAVRDSRSASPARSAHHSAPHLSHSRAGNARLKRLARPTATLE